jgi:hypothetical protein
MQHVQHTEAYFPAELPELFLLSTLLHYVNKSVFLSIHGNRCINWKHEDEVKLTLPPIT